MKPELMKLSNIFSRKNRILLRELVITDFKLRYQGSVLGYLWSLLKPLMLFGIMFIVFVHFLRFGVGIPHFAVSLLLGIVLWTFFTEATGQGMQAIVERGDLIRKINFPKYIVVISGTLSALINLCLNLLIVFVFMLFDGVDFGWSALLFPAYVALIFIFALAVAFLLSAVYVKYRDVGHIWDVVLQGLFYATPIIYPVQTVMAFNLVAAQSLLLSPIAALFQNARASLVGHDNVIVNTDIISNPWLIAVPYLVIVLTIIISTVYFRKNQRYFAERV